MTLEPVARTVVVMLASYGVVAMAASGLVAALWRVIVRRPATAPPRVVAGRLLALRLAPAVLGMGVAATVGALFLCFEPDLVREAIGWPALFAACGGGAMLVAGFCRAGRTARASLLLGPVGRVCPTVAIEGCPLEVRLVRGSFPVVALAGFFQPRVLVSERVLGACTRDELSAVFAHELAHLRAGDGLRRILFQVCPDPLAWMPAAGALESAWEEASEQAADEVAAGGDPRRRLLLAQALLKVARLARDAPRLRALPASALFRGEPVADRVRRLLSASHAPEPLRGAAGSMGLILVTVSLLFVLSVSGRHLFDLVEAALHF